MHIYCRFKKYTGKRNVIVSTLNDLMDDFIGFGRLYEQVFSRVDMCSNVEKPRSFYHSQKPSHSILAKKYKNYLHYTPRNILYFWDMRKLLRKQFPGTDLDPVGSRTMNLIRTDDFGLGSMSNKDQRF
jgi:hypothetical protein